MPKAPIILEAQKKDQPEAICIFLHGLGDTGDGWSWGFKDPSVRDPRVKYIFPTAKTMPVSLNGGFPMTAWFDIYGLDPGAKEDLPGIKSAADEIRQMINSELRKHTHLTHENVVLGGFSLGGALALYTGLSNPEKLGGIIALSTWLPARDEFQAISMQKGTPVLQGHGDADPVVPFMFGKLTNSLLQENGVKTDFKSYSGMAHSSCDQEMKDVKNFINGFL